jgi:hypothetical protein
MKRAEASFFKRIFEPTEKFSPTEKFVPTQLRRVFFKASWRIRNTNTYALVGAYAQVGAYTIVCA